MDTLNVINSVIAVIFTICYFYQFVFIPFVWFKRGKTEKHVQDKEHNFAILICARNEAEVLPDLLNSIKNQTYPADCIKTFVMADNCTDHTSYVAWKNGAVTYERNNRHLIGKGYALDALLEHIHADFGDVFDGYFVFDADNILSKNFIEEMNKTFSEGHQIITSYRNSKNYGNNWISAGSSLWFLRESRYLNHARMLLGTSCAVSGTGFLFGREVMNDMNGWSFHMMIEDIQFSIDRILKGYKIAFCETAELYDEQPMLFSESWNQRMRWARGYLQLMKRYGKDLLKGIAGGRFECFDMTMIIMPAYVLSMLTVINNLILGIWSAVVENSILVGLKTIAPMLWGMYCVCFVVGLITSITEWKHINTSGYKKVLYVFTFPFFMFTYIPISFAALFTKVEWKPIRHTYSSKKMTSAEMYNMTKK